MTPSQYVLEVLGLRPGDVAQQLGMRQAVVDSFLQEGRIHRGPPSSWRRGEGIPRPFARLLALHLGIHRAFLEDPEFGRTPMPINLSGDLPDALSGLFGRLSMKIGTDTGNHAGQAICASIFAGAAAEWMSPMHGQAIGFIGNGMDGYISRPEALSEFLCETRENGAGRVAMPPDPLNPERGINPELLLGIFELQDITGATDLLDPGLRTRLRGEMMPEYVAALQVFLKAEGHDVVLSGLNSVTVFYQSGYRRTINLGPGHNPVLSGIYRFVRDGRLPPFFVLGDKGWMGGIPMEKIAAIRFPWPMIARYGAHVDLDTDRPDTPAAPAVSRDAPDILVATREMLPTEKLETA